MGDTNEAEATSTEHFSQLHIFRIDFGDDTIGGEDDRMASLVHLRTDTTFERTILAEIIIGTGIALET